MKKVKINCLGENIHPTLTQEPLLKLPKHDYHDKDSTVIQKTVEGKAKHINRMGILKCDQETER